MDRRLIGQLDSLQEYNQKRDRLLANLRERRELAKEQSTYFGSHLVPLGQIDVALTGLMKEIGEKIDEGKTIKRRLEEKIAELDEVLESRRGDILVHQVIQVWSGNPMPIFGELPQDLPQCLGAFGSVRLGKKYPM